METKQQLVVVTGAAGSLGRAVAQHFIQAGARLILVDLDQKMLMRAFEGASEEHERVAADLTDAAQVEAALSAVLQRLGEVDVLCNIAGGFSMGPGVHETPDASWRHLMDLNVATLINTCRVVVPGMIQAGRGKIINIGSGTFYYGGPGMSHYVCSKGAIIAFTRSASREFGDKNILVNCIAPGLTESEGVKNHPDLHVARAPTVQTRAIKRDMVPEDLVGMLLFLASEDSDFVTGQTFNVDGGKYNQ